MSGTDFPGESTTSNGSTGGGGSGGNGKSGTNGGSGTNDTDQRQTVALAGFITIAVIAVAGIAIAGLFLVGSDTGLAVTGIDVNDSGGQDEPIAVTVTVENTADATVTDEIALQIGEGVSVSQEVQVAGGETTAVSFDVERSENLSAATSLSVSTSFDSSQIDFSIQGADIGVAVPSASDPIVEGQDLVVEAVVSNTGSKAWTDGDVTLQSGDGEVRDSTQVSIDPGQETTVELVWETDSGASSVGDVTVHAGGSTAQRSVDIQAVGGSPFYIVDIVEAPDSMTVGENRTLTADIENLAAVGGSATVTLTSDGFQNTERTVDVEGGETISETFTLEGTAVGTHTVVVDSGDTQDQREISVLEPGDLQMGSLTANNPTEGDPLDISFSVTNTGDTPISGTIDVDAGGLGSTSVSVDLAGGEQTQKSASLSTSEGDSGGYTVTLTYAQQTVSSTVSVQAADDDDNDDNGNNDSPLFSLAISSISPTDPVAGQEFTVTVDVTNNDEFTRPDTLLLTGDGVTDTQTSIAVSGGATESKTITSRFDSNIQEANIILETAQFDGNASRTVNLEPYAFGSTTAVELDPNQEQTVRTGAEVEFSATATDSFGNQFTDDSQFTWGSDGGDISSSGTFTALEAGQYDVTAEFDGTSSSTTTVTVESASVDEVTISGDFQPTAGETVSLDATAYDQYGNIVETDNTAFDWSGENISSDGQFQSETASEQDIIAAYDGVEKAVTVDVQPAAAARIEIDPAEDQTISSGGDVSFDATAYDQYGNLVESQDRQFNWDASGGSITNSGTFDETDPGTYNVTATYTDITSDQTTVTVNWSP